MAIATQVTYESDGRNGVWLVPFPYERADQVRAKVLEPGGGERLLDLGNDYVVTGQNVICVVPAGRKLMIWLAGNLEKAAEANSARAGAVEYADVLGQAAADPVTEQTAAEMTEAEAEKILAKARAAQGEMLAEAEKLMDGMSQEAAAALEDELKTTRNYLENLREQTRREADAAIRAAVQCSLYRKMPGVSAVKTEKEIGGASPGLFIVNPHLTHAPTPFMGVWPAKCENDMQWDGVFFIGPDYPDTVVIPPIRQIPDSSMPQAAGKADSWIPCNHSHVGSGC